jgi:hypothetical protein
VKVAGVAAGLAERREERRLVQADGGEQLVVELATGIATANPATHPSGGEKLYANGILTKLCPAGISYVAPAAVLVRPARATDGATTSTSLSATNRA